MHLRFLNYSLKLGFVLIKITSCIYPYYTEVVRRSLLKSKAYRTTFIKI